MKIESNRPKDFQKQLSKVINSLYQLEDLNQYRKNKLGIAINDLIKIINDVETHKEICKNINVKSNINVRKKK